jgi:hypothetical protein
MRARQGFSHPASRALTNAGKGSEVLQDTRDGSDGSDRRIILDPVETRTSGALRWDRLLHRNKISNSPEFQRFLDYMGQLSGYVYNPVTNPLWLGPEIMSSWATPDTLDPRLPCLRPIL